jgi:hypothetical protein
MKHEQEEILVDLDTMPACNETTASFSTGCLVKWKYGLPTDNGAQSDLYLIVGFDKESPNIAVVCSTNSNRLVRRFHISQLELVARH